MNVSCVYLPRCFRAASLVVLPIIAVIFWPHCLAGQHPAVPKLTLSQVEQLVSGKVPDSTLSAQIQKRGLAFAPTPAIVESLRTKGAGPLTLAAVAAVFPKGTGSVKLNETSATTDLDRTFVAYLEKEWNFYIREKIFLGPTYFGNSTSFGRDGNSLHALALISDYPAYRAFALKGLITLSELSLADAPTSVYSNKLVKIERAATVTLTQAGAKAGVVDNIANAVTFVLGTYRVEKITVNTAVETSDGQYRLVEGTHVLNIDPQFDDVWAELGWPRYRDRRFRIIFKYDSARSQWGNTVASNGRTTAEDTGPRGGNFDSETVPPTLDKLRRTHNNASNLGPFFGVWRKVGAGGYVKVIVSGSPEQPKVHLWGACSPQDCDFGEEDAQSDGSDLIATFQQGTDTTVYRLTLDQSANLQLNCHYHDTNPSRLPAPDGDCGTQSYTRTTPIASDVHGPSGSNGASKYSGARPHPRSASGPQIQMGKVEIQTEPGSHLILDGNEVGKAGVEGSLILPNVVAGDHEVVARSEGYRDASSRFSLVDKEDKQLSLPLDWLGGYLTISAVPKDSRIKVNGPQSFQGNATDSKVLPGAYTATVLSDGYTGQVHSFQVAAGEHHVEQFNLEIDLSSARIKANAGDRASLQALVDAIGRGEAVVCGVKYNTGVYPYFYLVSGTLKIAKSLVVFSVPIGGDDFAVSPDKILELVNQPQEASRLHLKVAIKNKKGDKEKNKDFYFYNTGAVTVGNGPGGTGLSISCAGCDNSMNVLFALLQKARSAE